LSPSLVISLSEENAVFAGSKGRFTLFRQLGCALLLAVLAVLDLSLQAWAHPLGNFTVNRYARIAVSDRRATLFYVVDMAEIPTQQEIAVVDSNRDGKMSDAEVAAYENEMARQLGLAAHLLVDGRQLNWQVTGHQLEFPPGQAELPTLRLTAQFAADLPAGATPWRAEFIDDNYADRLGWHEVIVQAEPGASLLESSAPGQDLSQELRQYPEDLLQSPPATNTAIFRFAPAGAGQPGNLQANAAPVDRLNASAGLDKPNDRFAELITIPTPGPSAILLALLAAFGWGALHALSPGHGKTIVAAYLVGSRGTAKHALFLGLTTTLTHTAGVFGLGFITLFASRYILPETLYPWLGLLSGLLVLLIGASLVWGRLSALPGIASHGHQHDHGHDHSHEHSHAGGHGHAHLPPGGEGGRVTWRSLLALGVSGGLLPCPSALVLMLGAIALERVAFGLVLILVFSIGLASVLTAIGITLVYAGQLFQRIPEGGRLLRVMPVASAAFIALIGAGISWQALVQTGILAGWLQ
jgi:ABC-type nickel/cobalt efflux system permease component RcnA